MSIKNIYHGMNYQIHIVVRESRKFPWGVRGMILFAGGGRGPMSSFGNFIKKFCRCMVTNHGLLFFFSKVGVWNLKSKYINIDVHFCTTKVKVFITLTILQQRVHASSSVCQCFVPHRKSPSVPHVLDIPYSCNYIHSPIYF